ncbi:MAG: hypothetical protein ABFS45_03775 [Pseudomonadota bacterium]
MLLGGRRPEKGVRAITRSVGKSFRFNPSTLGPSIDPVRPILAFDQAAAKWQAGERARLVSLGRTPPYADTQIAATSAVNGLILVTRNKQDFGDFKGVDVEDWFG